MFQPTNKKQKKIKNQKQIGDKDQNEEVKQYIIKDCIRLYQLPITNAQNYEY